MGKTPFECDLVHDDGREEFVQVHGKTLSVVHRSAGEVVNETQKVHRFAPQAKEAAKLYVWEARERGFNERVSAAPASPTPDAPKMLTLYRVTGRGTTATYLQDGKRLRTNDAIQEFESEADAEFALKRMIRPAKGTTITEEHLSRDVAGLSKLPLTDMVLENSIFFERSEGVGRTNVRFEEGATDPARYVPLVSDLAQSEAPTVHMFCNVQASPKAAWTTALAATDLPFRSLIFDTYWEHLTLQQEHSLGDLALTLARSPKLERLFVSGNVETSPLEHPALRELYLLGDPLSPSVLQALAESTLPCLHKLVLCLREYGDDNDDLLLSSLPRLNAPALRELCLYGVGEPLKVAVEVTRQLPSIRALAVGSFLDEDFEELTEEELESLAALEVLELDLDGSEPPTSIRERLKNLRELNTDRVLPTEYESW